MNDNLVNYLNDKIDNKNIIKHMLATKACMEGIYDYLDKKGTDNLGKKENWSMAGLMHDGDYTDNVPESKQGVQITADLIEAGISVPEEVAHAMAAHNPATKVKPESLMDWALFTCDTLTGLIVASALVLPDKKIESLKTKSILKRFKEKSFAKGARREDIIKCEDKLGINLEEYINICLTSMQNIAKELGL
jgi:predicted hydrolase (HD superfamily)